MLCCVALNKPGPQHHRKFSWKRCLEVTWSSSPTSLLTQDRHQVSEQPSVWRNVVNFFFIALHHRVSLPCKNLKRSFSRIILRVRIRPRWLNKYINTLIQNTWIQKNTLTSAIIKIRVKPKPEVTGFHWVAETQSRVISYSKGCPCSIPLLLQQRSGLP